MVRSRLIHVAVMVMVLVGSGFGAPALADGTTYYVRQGGSDQSDGLTPATALRSIQRAVAICAGAGNSIIVGPGVYYEQVLIGSGAGSSAGSGTTDSPNLIVADASGSETGDVASAVVIDGDGVREFGIALSRRDDWAIAGVSFRGQSRRAVSIDRCDGIAVQSCSIEAPRTAGIEAIDCDRLLIDGNTFLRSDHSGSSILVRARLRENNRRDDEHDEDENHDSHRDTERGNDDHGNDGRGDHEHGRVASSLTAAIQRNRFSMTGESYLGSGYGQEGRGRHNRHGRAVYGIRVEMRGDHASAQIINNVGSDCWAGISLRLDGDHASGVIANNSLAGCRVGIEVDADHGSVLLADNIIAHSRFAISADQRQSGIAISGLLTFEIGGSVVVGTGGLGSLVGQVQSVDPLWVAPGAGNFALEAGSPAVDAGLGAAGVSSDLRGMQRPWDGDGDGQAVADLGACEYHPEEDQNRRLRMVRWREIEPQ